jgi:hypothetical protein
MMHSTRRNVLTAAAAITAALVPEWLIAEQVIKEIHELKPGEFTWAPERSPNGPVAIVVSLPDQRVHVYRNGVRIAVSTCSTGRAGHTTPTGVFTILQKDRNHRSSTYNDAPMPNMNRLTWSGIALHAGQLPGYPASHGCVRLPSEFSKLLFSITHVGTPVIIANDHSDPVQIAHPGLILDPGAEARMDKAVAALPIKHPAVEAAAADAPSLSLVVSSADSRIVVLENGEEIAAGGVTIRDPGTPLGSHVYVLSAAADGHTYWHGIGFHRDFKSEASDLATLQRIKSDDKVRDAIRDRLHVGAILTTIDLPLTADARSGKDFVIVDTETS